MQYFINFVVTPIISLILVLIYEKIRKLLIARQKMKQEKQWYASKHDAGELKSSEELKSVYINLKADMHNHIFIIKAMRKYLINK